MTAKGKIADFLIRTGGSYCSRCISKELDLQFPEEVEREISALIEEAFVIRSEGICMSCFSRQLVTRRRLSAYSA